LVAVHWPRTRIVANWWRSALRGDREAIFDAAVDALTQAIANPSRDTTKDAWPYISRNLTRRMLDAMRRKKYLRRQSVSLDDIGEIESRAGPTLFTEECPLRSIAPLLDALSARQRELISRHYMGGESFPAIALSCGMNADAARKATNRAILSMRRRKYNHNDDWRVR
jgi:DNA-directed RNA polymerase specialized sigma24 family protein